MHLRIKTLWTEDLRINGDKQGFGALRRGDCYCPLGRLCELHRLEVGGVWVRTDVIDGTYKYLNNQSSLPGVVVKWAGLTTFYPRINNTRILTLNDDQRKSFPEIADEIEAHV